MIEITEKRPTEDVPPDNVNHPSHYETGKFECIDVMLETQGEEAVKAFCICNAMKYLYRHKNKNGREDIAKAVWYLNKYLELSADEPKVIHCKDELILTAPGEFVLRSENGVETPLSPREARAWLEDSL